MRELIISPRHRTLVPRRTDSASLQVSFPAEYVAHKGYWLHAQHPLDHADLETMTKQQSKSQFNEDMIFFEHFYPDAAQTGGVFFEMGALDGVFLSNTHQLGR